MSYIIDARGRSCPEPVIMTKKAIDTSQANFKILVDTKVAVENITRFAEGKGYKVSIIDNEEEFEIKIER